MYAKKKGRDARMPAKMIIPIQNFHRKEAIFQAEVQVGPGWG
jgi:hypothetical protein